tara:strand:+ start:577 stop:753 length:177 start_codon:yes stop_codon:yes gene_type:complete
MSAPPPVSDISLFSQLQRVIDLDTEISDGALDLGMTEQQLDRPQTVCTAVNHRRLGAP